ncbi:16S rRNA (uracil(1498)-N(3))-methyltransferase [Ferviditalea candida]|uniref:Ribosomal RNA small subunit methyltransferase E n=1 Tax=Ferviditalea candida TaxID=3108399 RepID=A0ABU5ZDZ9_9BACL|nr:16S rRNA (uracil(1498)-N(3))-methyltransferase [Paenibacillaceae bacterium T2]
MQRYFIPADRFDGSTVEIQGDDAHHIARVMRARTGDKIIVSDGMEREAIVEIRQIDAGRVTASIVEPLALTGEPRHRVWVFQGLPKGDKMETVIQKGTEIGASRFLPFLSERTVVKYDVKKEEKRIERWRKIAKEAAEQAHRNRIPSIDPPVSWRQMLAEVAQADAAFLLYEKERGASFKNALQRALSDLDAARPLTLAVIVGPEGGFSEAEVGQAEAAGCVPAGLGKRILRTETAALVALACILYETNEMGG